MKLQDAINSTINASSGDCYNKNQDIAIIGVGFKLPKASNLIELRELLQSGIDCIEYPKEKRKKLIEIFQDKKIEYEYFPGAYIDDIDKFDYTFFKMTKKEAELMDPHQRLFLQIGWKTFEDAGYTTEMLKGSKTGIFVGYPQQHSYYEKVKELSPQYAMMAGPGNMNSVIASRLSYVLDLTGPALMIDTSCSSSLVALSQACMAIHSNQCDSALVGGINLLIPNAVEKGEELPKIISSIYRTRTFSGDSDGTGMGEAIVAVLLKPLDKAMKSNDHIYAVIKGFNINNDGKSLGLTAPNQASQVKVISDAWSKSNINPEEISYIEAHGTGTELGDPIELSAISEAFLKHTHKKQFCGIGSIKSYYGHTDSASGLLGILKCIVSLKNKELYPNANFTYPTPNFNFLNSPLYVVNDKLNWSELYKGVKVCAVSSFGLSGTNCHVILQEYREKEKVNTDGDLNKARMLPITAKSKEALKNIINEYFKFLQVNKLVNLDDLCYTTQRRRNHYEYRVVFVFNTLTDLISKMKVFLEENVYYEKGIVIPNEKYRKNILWKLSYDDIPTEIFNSVEEYIKGKNIIWGKFRNAKNISLPTYQFEESSVWIIEEEKNNTIVSAVDNEENIISLADENIISEVKEIVSNIFGISSTKIESDKDFFEIGFDSISIIQLKHSILDNYGIDIAIENFFTDYNTIEKLSQIIKNKSNKIKNKSFIKEEKNLETIRNDRSLRDGKIDDSLIHLFNRQLDIIENQMEHLRNGDLLRKTSQEIVDTKTREYKKSLTNEKVAVIENQDISDSYTKRFWVKKTSILSEKQERFLNSFTDKYCKKFIKSKQFVNQSKLTWANSRFIQGYSEVWKKLSFPIFTNEAMGVSMKDIDENNFLDFSMGFGVNLLGYNNPILYNCLKESIQKKLILGPITQEAAEVADLIKEATGVERVAFCNSGTEAVMNLMRIARAVTNKKEIIVFKNSYHGTFDGVYVSSSGNKTIPLSLGTTPEMVENITILNYGEEETIQYIHTHKDKIAAVLVEPIQSRNPDFQPKEFLKDLRKITEENNIIYIFDEIITGFRLCLGGAQEYFGVEADLIAYGKVVGGGLPIGIYGGKAKYMDRVDGGVYDEQSKPNTVVVQTGGTFCHHPLSMTSAKVMLKYLIKNNGRLQKKLNYKTKTMANYLNKYFERYNIPMHIAVGGSQFLIFSDDSTLIRMLYYLLLYNNIYIWEGGTCYLSSEHTDNDIATLVVKVIENIGVLVSNECFNYNIDLNNLNTEEIKSEILSELYYEDEDLRFLEEKDKDKAEQLIASEEVEYVVPVTPMQYLVLSQNIGLRKSGQDIVVETYVFESSINEKYLKKSCDFVVKRNPVLRSEYLWRRWEKPVQVTYYYEKSQFEYMDLSEYKVDIQENLIKSRLNEIKKIGLNEKRSKILFLLVKQGFNKYCFNMIYTNSLFDGWSSNCIITSLLTYYEKIMAGEKIVVKTDKSYIKYALDVANNNIKKNIDFWKDEMSPCKDFILKKEYKEETYSFESAMLSVKLEDDFKNLLQDTAVANRVSVSSIIQAAWIKNMFKIKKENEVIVGLATLGRSSGIDGINNSVGLYTNILPMYINYEENESIEEFVSRVNIKMLSIMNNENITTYEIAEFSKVPLKLINKCVDEDTIVFINFPVNRMNVETINVVTKGEEGSMNISRRIYIEIGDTVNIICRYNRCKYHKKEINEIIMNLKEQIILIVKGLENKE